MVSWAPQRKMRLRINSLKIKVQIWRWLGDTKRPCASGYVIVPNMVRDVDSIWFKLKHTWSHMLRVILLVIIMNEHEWTIMKPCEEELKSSLQLNTKHIKTWPASAICLMVFNFEPDRATQGQGGSLVVICVNNLLVSEIMWLPGCYWLKDAWWMSSSTTFSQGTVALNGSYWRSQMFSAAMSAKKLGSSDPPLIRISTKYAKRLGTYDLF